MSQTNRSYIIEKKKHFLDLSQLKALLSILTLSIKLPEEYRCGVVMKFQSASPRYRAPLKAGTWLSGGGVPPASSNRTLHPATSERRAAITLPAEPAPTVKNKGRKGYFLC